MNENKNSGRAALYVTLVVSTLLASPLVATPVIEGDQDPAARSADQIGRSADLGISTTSLPLRRNGEAMWSANYAGADARQSFVVEPDTLALVGLGLLGIGIARRLKTRRRPD